MQIKCKTDQTRQARIEALRWAVNMAASYASIVENTRRFLAPDAQEYRARNYDDFLKRELLLIAMADELEEAKQP